MKCSPTQQLTNRRQRAGKNTRGSEVKLARNLDKLKVLGLSTFFN